MSRELSPERDTRVRLVSVKTKTFECELGHIRDRFFGRPSTGQVPRCKALGIDVPPTLVLRTDEVVE
jgi:hypothetical protein